MLYSSVMLQDTSKSQELPEAPRDYSTPSVWLLLQTSPAHLSRSSLRRERGPLCFFPEAIPAASCSCCLRECAPGAHFMSFLQQKPQNKNRKKIPKLYRAWRELTYHLRGVSIAAEMRRCSTSLISFCNIFIILVYLSFPERLAVFPHNNWSIIHLRLFTDTASCTCWISSG